MENETTTHRLSLLKSSRRVVVKAGSAVLTSAEGMNGRVISDLAEGISALIDSGREVILVSSGAVAAGRRKLHFQSGSPLSIRQKQALAAIGQSHLMHDYAEAFAVHQRDIAQILLTHSDLASRSRYLNVRNTIHTLLNYGIVPILNENDSVSTKELKFSDNDNLGALICNLLEADIYISLTDIDALYDSNPAENPQAKPVHLVAEVTPEILAMCGPSDDAVGTGGMETKVRAARTVASGGGSSVIAPGREPGVLQRIFAGEQLGTFFLPSAEKMQSRKRWIAWVLKPQGRLLLDEGACTAIKERGTSLLASGIVAVEGSFSKGDAVECVTPDGRVFAVGLAGCDSLVAARIKGLRSDQIDAAFAGEYSGEVLHRDNLVLV